MTMSRYLAAAVGPLLVGSYLIAPPAQAVTSVSEVDAPVSEQNYIVELGRGTSVAEMVDRTDVSKQDVESKQSGPVFKGAVVSLTPAEAQELADEPGVRQVVPDTPVAISGDAVTWGQDRSDQRSGLDGSYTPPGDGSGVHVYVIDTGIDVDHPEFAGRMGAGYDATGGNDPDDCNGHGTHVAGTVGSSVYGLADQVTLHPVKALYCSGSGWTSDIVESLNWVAANAPAKSVVNMSLGGGANSLLDATVADVVAAGIPVVAAAGNDTTDACNASPAGAAEAITVGASTSTDAFAGFSNYGTCVDLFAPGLSIPSTKLGGTGGTGMSGTSMAAPHVAAAAAIYWSVFPEATATQIVSGIDEWATTGKLSNLPAGSPDKLLYVRFDGSNPPAPDPDPDPEPEPEPVDLGGDSRSSATLVDIPGSWFDTIHSNSDVDWYTFPIGRAGSVSVTLDNLPTDYDLEVTTPSGAYTSNRGGTTSDSVSFTTSTEHVGQSVFIKVYPYSSPVTSANYRLSVACEGSCVPEVPDAPTVSAVDSGDASALVTWTAPASDGGSVITDYEYRLNGAGGWVSLATTGTSATITGLTNGTTYGVQVRAVNAVGAGAASNSRDVFPVKPGIRSVSGSLTTSDGIAMSGVDVLAVSVDDSLESTVTTNSQGQFTVTATTHTDTRLVLSHDSFGMPEALLRPQDARADLTLPQEHRTTVIVTDKDGHRVTNAQVEPSQRFSWSLTGSLWPQSGAVDGWLPGRTGGTTDSDGRSVLSGFGPLPAGQKLARVSAVISPGTTQSTTVTTDQATGADPYRQVAGAVLPYLPTVDATGANGAVQVTSKDGTAIAGAHMELVPVLSSDTRERPAEGAVVATATTGSDGVAKFDTSALTPGLYRAKAVELTMRTIDLNVKTAVDPPVSDPDSGSSTDPDDGRTTTDPEDEQTKAAQVTVKSAAKKTRLKIDVDPDDVTGQWRVVLQKKTKKSGWKKVTRVVTVKSKKAKRVKARKLKTRGDRHRLVVDPKKGTYRVLVRADHGYSSAVSQTIRLRG
jgi:subtilisin family serine protease